MKKINWGIIGCGGIAHTFAKGLIQLKTGKLSAVASNSEERAKLFADSYNVETYYTNYEALVNDPTINAVYIATTHNFHFENVKLCITHGKHVLCEKPLTVNAKQAKILIELAKTHGVFLMEAVWTRFLPAITQLKQLIESDVIGRVKTVKATFNINGDFAPSHRLLNIELAGGALLDLGIYPITFAHLAFGEHPKRIKSSADIGETGVDESSFYLFEYDNGRNAILSSSFTDSSPTKAIISGTKGYIVVPEFLAARELLIYKNGEDKQVLTFDRSDDDNFMFEIEHANKCINENKHESPLFPLSDTLKVMETMDTLRQQWGLVYKDD